MGIKSGVNLERLMNKKIFSELLSGVKQAEEIIKGSSEPARVTEYCAKRKRNMPKSEVLPIGSFGVKQK